MEELNVSIELEVNFNWLELLKELADENGKDVREMMFILIEEGYWNLFNNTPTSVRGKEIKLPPMVDVGD